jgi:hypothetical protein
MPSPTRRESSYALSLALLLQSVDHRLGDGYGPAARGGLGLDQEVLPVDPLEGMADVDLAPLRVEVIPGEAQQFALAQSAE